MKYKFILYLIISVLSLPRICAQTYDDKETRMQWFKDAKLGIFIHWGIYSVDGIGESWSFHNGHISYEDYMKQLDGFSAKNYDPDYWAKLIKESGAKYAVLTSKHHDGVALWDTKQSDLSLVKKSPAARDLIGPFCLALRDKDLKVGLYYSLIDWSHPDYPNFLRNKKRYSDDPVKWQRFVKFNFGQLKELSKQYKPDLFWFDGDWEQTAEDWKAKELRESLFKWNPKVVLNSRLQGYGDYDTPEQGLPVTKPDSKYWELCMTINDSWGYQPNDNNYKTANQIIEMFIECISMGGNLLLDVGPKEDGTIPEEQLSVLKELGRWTNKHHESIYGTVAGIPPGHFYGATALSKDHQTLYLYVNNKPNGSLMIKGLKNNIKKIWVVGEDTNLDYKIIGKRSWSEVPGIIYVDLPGEVLDQQVTVIGVSLDGPVDLYREDGQKIESN